MTHKSSACPNTVCERCSRAGRAATSHLEKDCPICELCGSQTHADWVDCPEYICGRCGRQGHSGSDCPNLGPRLAIRLRDR